MDVLAKHTLAHTAHSEMIIRLRAEDDMQYFWSEGISYYIIANIHTHITRMQDHSYNNEREIRREKKNNNLKYDK